MESKGIFLLERPEHIGLLREKMYARDTIIAINSESSYELQRYEIKHRCIQDYFSAEEYFELYDVGESKREAIIEYFDAILESIDRRFPDSGLKPFYSNNYFIQLLLDDILAVIFKLHKLFSAEKCDCVRSIRFGVNNVQKNFIAYDAVWESAYNSVLPLMASAYQYQCELYEYQDYPPDVAQAKNQLYSSLKRIYAAFKGDPSVVNRKVRRILGQILQNVQPGARKRLLSVGCRDLETIAPTLISNGWFLDKFPAERLRKELGIIPSYRSTREFFDKVDAEKDIFCFCGANFYSVFKEKITPLVERLEYYHSYYQLLEKYVQRNNFNLVAFSSHTPHQPVNVLLPQILRKERIPYLCWMHGFYGCNETSVGWTNTDYLYGESYLVYGEKVKALIDTRHTEYQLQTFVAGAPRLEHFRKTYRPPINDNKVIVFVLQAFTTNRQPFGLKSRDIINNHWQTIRYIIDQLKGFENSYRIILRPIDGERGNQTQLLKKYLEDIKATSIEIRTHDECTLQSLYRKSDLIINLWASMSLMEGCLTHSDIFLYDRSDLTTDAIAAMGNRVFWYNDLAEFGTALAGYLLAGNFYQKSADDEFLDSYMDIGNIMSREQHVLQILEHLKKG